MTDDNGHLATIDSKFISYQIRLFEIVESHIGEKATNSQAFCLQRMRNASNDNMYKLRHCLQFTVSLNWNLLQIGMHIGLKHEKYYYYYMTYRLCLDA